MEPGERLKIAGEAACLLEEQGFVAVARLKQGVVFLEFWKGSKAMRYELPDTPLAAQALAAACATEYRERVQDN
jgi:hypothetical protein